MQEKAALAKETEQIKTSKALQDEEIGRLKAQQLSQETKIIDLINQFAKLQKSEIRPRQYPSQTRYDNIQPEATNKSMNDERY